jgi:hypothetical protein
MAQYQLNLDALTNGPFDGSDGHLQERWNRQAQVSQA